LVSEAVYDIKSGRRDTQYKSVRKKRVKRNGSHAIVWTQTKLCTLTGMGALLLWLLHPTQVRQPKFSTKDPEVLKIYMLVQIGTSRDKTVYACANVFAIFVCLL